MGLLFGPQDAAQITVGAPLLMAIVTASWLWLARGRRAAQWDEAWEQIQRQPAISLSLLEQFAPPQSRLPDARAQRPHWQQARYGQAICHIRLGDFTAAEAALRDAQQHLPALDEQAQLSAALLAAAGREPPRLAIESWCRFLALTPQLEFRETRRLVERGLARHLLPKASDSREQLESRLALADRALAIAPGIPAAQRQRGLALVRLRRFAESLVPLGIALKARPDDIVALRALATALRTTDERQRLCDTLLAIHQLRPSAALAYEAAQLTLDLAAGAAGGSPPEAKLAQAQALLEAAVQHDPALPQAWLALAKILWRRGQHQDALRSVQRVLALDLSIPESYFLLCDCYLAAGNAPEARQALARALELDPGNPVSLRLSADLDFGEGNYSAALASYQRLPADQQREPALQNRLARCYLEAGQPQPAADLLANRDALEPASRATLARALARLGHWEQALHTWQASPPPPADAEASYYYAAALAATAHADQALAIFTRLQENPAWSSRARRQLGHLRLQQRDAAQAAELYRLSGLPLTALDRARLAFVDGDAQQAREQFALVADAPASRDARRFGLALADAALGDSSGLEALRRDPALAPAAAEALADRAYESRRYLDALPHYQVSLAAQSIPSIRLLQRLAGCYVHLQRDRDALTHLIALVQRQPAAAGPAMHLALCQLRLARGHFAQSQWQSAQRSFAAAYEAALPHNSKAARAILAWALEAAYRETLAILESNSTSAADIDRAVEMCRFGCQHAGLDPRWQLVAGIATARDGELTASIQHFQQVRRLAPLNLPALLGLALSQHEAGQTAAARKSLEELLDQIERTKADGSQALRVTACFALAMTAASQRDWAAAAAALTPLITHPLIQRSKQPSPRDVAEVALAYHAAAGNQQQASELAKAHLPESKGLSDVLVGLVQADAKDFAGAATTLARAYRADPNPKLLGVLVGCLVAVAAGRALQGDHAAATQSLAEALRFDPNHKGAKDLQSALGFAGSFHGLNLAQLDEAIRQCQQQLAGGDQSPQLVRSLAVLLLRKAEQAEKSNRDPDAAWNLCLSFWRTRILANPAFWSKFAESYNAGRGKREQLQPDEVLALRGAVIERLVELHLGYAQFFRHNRSENGLVRHLNLIGQWKPDFRPSDQLLDALVNMADLDDWQAEMLEKAANRLSSAPLQAALKSRLAIYWYNAGAAIVTELNEEKKRGRAVTGTEKCRRAKSLLTRAYKLDPSDADICNLYKLADRL